MDEKFIHTGLGPSPGIQVNGSVPVFGASVFRCGFEVAAVEFQIEIAGDWLPLGVIRFPYHDIPEKVRSMGKGQFAFDFISPDGVHSYRWECVQISAGKVTTYIVG